MNESIAQRPDRPRVRYNYGLALQSLGKTSEAENQLLRAYQADPTAPDLANALVSFYLQQRNLAQALTYAERLAALQPGNASVTALVSQIREALARR